MPALVAYLIKLSVSLSVVFLFYQLVLRPLTFHVWNRWYLLGYTILAFFIPFINITPVLQHNAWSNNIAIQWVPLITDGSSTTIANSSAHFTMWDIGEIMLLMGIAIMTMRLLIQFISFRRLMKKAQFVQSNELRIYEVDENIIPFSFGRSIFINPALHNSAELQEIIKHEFIHVKQAHSIDIIWSELLCVLNWYNPFAWLLRRSIRQNLEFIADHKVLETGIEKKTISVFIAQSDGQ